jgi:hypothetical protein
MTTDRTTKALLALIATALWLLVLMQATPPANAAAQLSQQPVRVIVEDIKVVGGRNPLVWAWQVHCVNCQSEPAGR